MRYKLSIKTPRRNINDDTDQRGPSLKSIQEKLRQYSVGYNGVIVLHHSMYDYQYATRRLLYYASVDSSGIVGHIEDVVIENDTVYLIAILDDLRFDSTKDYICTYRAMMQSDPTKNNELMIVNLFSVDLILIQPEEKLESMILSTISIEQEPSENMDVLTSKG